MSQNQNSTRVSFKELLKAMSKDEVLAHKVGTSRGGGSRKSKYDDLVTEFKALPVGDILPLDDHKKYGFTDRLNGQIVSGDEYWNLNRKNIGIKLNRMDDGLYNLTFVIHLLDIPEYGKCLAIEKLSDPTQVDFNDGGTLEM